MKIIDLHCDTLSKVYEYNLGLYENSLQYDLKRAFNSNIAIQFFALFTMPNDSNNALQEILKQIDVFYAELSTNEDKLYLIKNADDIKRNQSHNKIGAVLHLEGGEALGDDLAYLRILYRLGIRSIGLTWNRRNLLADGIGEGPLGGGLSKQGRTVLQEMEKLKMITDLSHISERAFFEVLEHYRYPLMVTHANVRNLCPHPRNLTDQQLLALAENDGVVGVNQVKDFVKEINPTVSDLLDHISYIADKIGVRHLALGSDFDGADEVVMPGIEHYQSWQALLSRRGFTEQEISMIFNGNAQRVIAAVI